MVTKPRSRASRFSIDLGAPKARLIALWLFVCTMFLMGGSSRFDIASIVILRVVAVGYGAYALSYCATAQLRQAGFPLLIIAAIALTMGAQLVPLPHDIWSALPGRNMIAANDVIADMPELWRPLSLMPSATWNSLLSLVVPAAALLGLASLNPEHRRHVWLMIFALGVVSCGLGILQIGFSGATDLYFYRITNEGSAVGLFANRNHNSVFLAIALLAAAYIVDEQRRRQAPNNMMIAVAVLGTLLIVPSILMIGSRAGLVAGGVSLAVSILYMLPANRAASAGHRRQWQLIVFIPLIVMLILSAIVMLSDRTTAFDRFFVGSYAEDTRGLTLPYTLDMMRTYWTTGSGFGSYAAVYKTIEPDALLEPTYMNQAHNDWLQWIIEGGVPALVVLIVAIIWFGCRAYISRSRWMPSARVDGPPPLAVAALLIYALASAADYTLRVPSQMVVFAVCAGLLAFDGAPIARIAPRQSGRTRHARRSVQPTA